LATLPKSLLGQNRRNSPDSRRIARLSEQPGLSEAPKWFARERQWIADQHLAVSRIPAPTFFESKRASWCVDQLRSLGWDASLDRAGNVLAIGGAGPEPPLIAVTAHLDTVLAPHRPEDISVLPDGKLHGPGVADNASGLTALLSIARILKELPELHSIASSIVIVANVGEEGEGNLSGMRYLCRPSPLLDRIKAFVILDGPSLEHITSQALASRRYEVSFQGPGGHSWNDQGVANPVHALSHAISAFVQSAEGLQQPGACRLAYNFGIIEGGASINSIPATALGKLDLRSEDAELLDESSALLTNSVERALELENRNARGGRISGKIRELGARPGGRLGPDSFLLRAIEAVDAHLHVRAAINCASTDANIPLSLGLPAISIGTGGQGGGAHTAQEWFHPEGRALGLHRVLLLLASLTETIARGADVSESPSA
jgi:tripeptide aminopeptidase